jgi:hypothetical protein
MNGSVGDELHSWVGQGYHMLQALWSLEVLLAEGAVPAGVLIFHLRRVFGDYYQTGRLLGGDSRSHYVGEYQIENLGLAGRFTAIRHGGVDPTPFGEKDRHDITFTGMLEANLERDVLILDATVDAAIDTATATDAGGAHPIQLRLTKRAPLA